MVTAVPARSTLFSSNGCSNNIETFRVAIHGLVAEARVPRLFFARRLPLLLAGYSPAAPFAAADVELAVVPGSKRGLWDVALASERFPDIVGADLAAQRVEWVIAKETVNRLPRFIHVHGAVVATANQSLLLVGHSGRGKSTTAVALAQAGLTLFTDDVALIGREDLRPVSVPRPIKLDRGSRMLLRRLGLAIPRAARLRESVSRVVLPGQPPPDVPGPPVTKIVFLAPERGERSELRTMIAAEALMRFIQQSLSEQFEMVGGGVSDGALAIIEAADCYELVVGPIEETVTRLIDLIEMQS